SPQIQTASAKITRNKPNQRTPVLPSRDAVTQNNQTAVASMGKPMATLKRCIQRPGLGRNFSHAGCQQSSTNGAAKPNPTARNIRMMIAGGWVKAKAMAGARNGAVHGVASKVASTPLKKAPA